LRTTFKHGMKESEREVLYRGQKYVAVKGCLKKNCIRTGKRKGGENGFAAQKKNKMRGGTKKESFFSKATASTGEGGHRPKTTKELF